MQKKYCHIFKDYWIPSALGPFCSDHLPNIIKLAVSEFLKFCKNKFQYNKQQPKLKIKIAGDCNFTSNVRFKICQYPIKKTSAIRYLAIKKSYLN